MHIIFYIYNFIKSNYTFQFIGSSWNGSTKMKKLHNKKMPKLLRM